MAMPVLMHANTCCMPTLLLCSCSTLMLGQMQQSSESGCTASAASSWAVRYLKHAAYAVSPSARCSPPLGTRTSCCCWGVCIASITSAGMTGVRSSLHALAASSQCHWHSSVEQYQGIAMCRCGDNCIEVFGDCEQEVRFTRFDIPLPPYSTLTPA